MMRGTFRPASRLIQRRILLTVEKRALAQTILINKRTLTTTAHHPRFNSPSPSVNPLESYQITSSSKVIQPNNDIMHRNVCLDTSLLMIAFPEHKIIAMPALSPTMTQGAIGTWQKKVGDPITPGDVLVEIETDKAQMDFECQDEGFLAKILAESGEKDVVVGTVHPLSPSKSSSLSTHIL